MLCWHFLCQWSWFVKRISISYKRQKLFFDTHLWVRSWLSEITALKIGDAQQALSETCTGLPCLSLCGEMVSSGKKCNKKKGSRYPNKMAFASKMHNEMTQKCVVSIVKWKKTLKRGRNDWCLWEKRGKIWRIWVEKRGKTLWDLNVEVSSIVQKAFRNNNHKYNVVERWQLS